MHYVPKWLDTLKKILQQMILVCLTILGRSALKGYSGKKSRRLKGKRANLKTSVSRKESTPNFPKNEHFLTLDT